jgi:hypothetical protein
MMYARCEVKDLNNLDGVNPSGNTIDSRQVEC